VVSPDRKISSQWDCDVETIGADQVWTGSGSGPGYQGTGVGIAILDTGVVTTAARASTDFNVFGSSTSRIVAWKDFVNARATPYDDNGHGTHVAGIALGSGNNSPLNGSRGRLRVLRLRQT